MVGGKEIRQEQAKGEAELPRSANKVPADLRGLFQSLPKVEQEDHAFAPHINLSLTGMTQEDAWPWARHSPSQGQFQERLTAESYQRAQQADVGCGKHSNVQSIHSQSGTRP